MMDGRVHCDTLVNSTHTKATVDVLEAAEKMLILAEILRILSVELIIIQAMHIIHGERSMDRQRHAWFHNLLEGIGTRPVLQSHAVAARVEDSIRSARWQFHRAVLLTERDLPEDELPVRTTRRIEISLVWPVLAEYYSLFAVWGCATGVCGFARSKIKRSIKTWTSEKRIKRQKL
jgi:hypothetical protein